MTTIPPLMSTEMPEVLDAWRMVAGRRQFRGRWPLAAFPRLRDSLVDVDGEVQASLAFDRTVSGQACAELRIRAGLPLQCQRSLQRFVHPVDIRQQLGLIRDEADEAGLPEGCEPLLLADDGRLRPVEVVEDELILAVPVIPVAPGTEAIDRHWPVDAREAAASHPFAALAALKRDDREAT